MMKLVFLKNLLWSLPVLLLSTDQVPRALHTWPPVPQLSSPQLHTLNCIHWLQHSWSV